MPARSPVPGQLLREIEKNLLVTRDELVEKTGAKREVVNKHLQRLKAAKVISEGFHLGPNWSKHTRWGKHIIFVATKYPGPAHDKERPKENSDDQDVIVRNPDTEDFQEDLCEAINKKLSDDSELSQDLVSEKIEILTGGGDWDVMVVLYAEHHEDVNKFVRRWVRKQPAVAKTNTVSVSTPEWFVAKQRDSDVETPED